MAYLSSRDCFVSWLLGRDGAGQRGRGPSIAISPSAPDLPTCTPPTAQTDCVRGTSASPSRTHRCLPKAGLTSDQVAPRRCQIRSFTPMPTRASAQMPPAPSGVMASSCQTVDVARMGRTLTDQLVPFHAAASGVVPLALFLAEPPNQTSPFGSTAAL